MLVYHQQIYLQQFILSNLSSKFLWFVLLGFWWHDAWLCFILLQIQHFCGTYSLNPNKHVLDMLSAKLKY